MVFTEFTKSTLETILFLLCVTGVALLAGQWVLQGYFNELTVNIVTAANQQANANQEIKEINRVLRVTGEIQNGYTLWTPLIEELLPSIPEQITLSELNIERQKQTIILSGFAKTRDDLLSLQQALEQVSFIDSINMPLSQLTKKENISFSFVAKTK